MTPTLPSPADVTANELLQAVGQILRRLRLDANPDALNMSQMGSLARLEQTGAMTTAELARAEGMKPQSMGTVLAGLEQEGFVERQPHPTDGRQVLFVLTVKGADEGQRRRVAKRAWLVAALAKFNQSELEALITSIPLIKRLGEE